MRSRFARATDRRGGGIRPLAVAAQRSRLDATLAAAARSLKRGGLLGVDLFPIFPCGGIPGRIPIRASCAWHHTDPGGVPSGRIAEKASRIFDEQYSSVAAAPSDRTAFSSRFGH